jgi:hypothetical protein
MEAQGYYICRVRLNGQELFLAWSHGEPDRFLRDAEGGLPVTRSSESLAALARESGLRQVSEEPADYDFDRIRKWCAAPNSTGVECSTFLNAWNFFDDLAGLHGGADNAYTWLSRRAAPCYDKLFWGNNLLAVTPVGKEYIPAWQSDELESIRQVLDAGIDLLEVELSSANGRLQ